MKKLLLMLLLPLLSGCVTYYYPETAIEDGVYYAEADPAYLNNSYVDYSYGYAGSAYYPWWSMDYFYLGYGPRVGFGYGYGGYAYGGGGFSIGLSYGYSPWYYPYYSYYSPWHYPYYRHGYGHGNGHKKGHKNNGGGGNHAGGNHDRYADNDRTYRRNRGGEDEDGNEDPGGRRGGDHTGSLGPSPVRRYVSTAPSGYSGNQGMVIRKRETTKIGKSRLEPVRANPLDKTVLTPSTTRATQRVYRSRRGGGEIRYRSATKQSRSRTGPVDRRLPATQAVVSTPTQTTYRSRQVGSEVRYRSDSKQGKSRTSPVRSGPARTIPVATVTPSRSATGTSGNRSQPRVSNHGNSSRRPSGHSSAGRSRSGHSSARQSSGHGSGHR